jgi:hypothetical protein
MLEKSSYDKDFYKWTQVQASLLKKNKFEKVDLEHVIEEIESLGKSERSELKNQMIRLLMHLLKVKYQPTKHTKSWDKSIGNAKIEIEDILLENPSLKREMPKVFEEAYQSSRKRAAIETSLELKNFPVKCPWELKDILKSDND